MNLENDEVQSLKEKGNLCVRNGNYEEAILHYSNAIDLDPSNASLFSNRSLAFLKVKKYYQSYEDALETIRLNPDWAKGYFRKGEVESATFQFSDALTSYNVALKLQPNDLTLEEIIKRTVLDIQKDRKADEQVPWLGAGLGIIFGVAIVLADQFLASKPVITHPIAMALLTILVALFGFSVAKGLYYFKKYQRKGLLDPPVELMKDTSQENDSNNLKDGEKGGSTHQRYTKAQARLRLRKGKS